jgi:hypothetical protein
MATKGERHRSEQQRSGPKRPPALERPRRDSPVDTALPGVSATDRRAGGGSTAARNDSAAAARKAAYALEDSAGDRPSRKSTRRSRNRQKPDSSLNRRAMNRTAAPGRRRAKR